MAGRAWNSSLACRCHSSMVSRYTIFVYVMIVLLLVSTRCCNRTRTGIASNLSPRRFAGPIEGMKSGLGAWERVDHAFSLVREEHEVTAVVRAVHPASRDSLLHSTTCFSLASRERPHLSSPKVLLATIIQEIYIASL